MGLPTDGIDNSSSSWTDYLPGASIGLGLLNGIFGSNPEEERQKRKQELIANYTKQWQKNKADAITMMQKRNAGVLGNVRQAAGTRAAASGRPDLAESLILPAQENAINQGNMAIDNTNQQYDNKLLDFTQNVEGDFANRPIEPTFMDYLSNGVGNAAKYSLANKAIAYGQPKDTWSA